MPEVGTQTGVVGAIAAGTTALGIFMDRLLRAYREHRRGFRQDAAEQALRDETGQLNASLVAAVTAQVEPLRQQVLRLVGDLERADLQIRDLRRQVTQERTARENERSIVVQTLAQHGIPIPTVLQWATPIDLTDHHPDRHDL